MFVFHLIQKHDDEVMADAEVGFVEFVGHVEPEALELPPFEKDGVEPRQRKEQLAVPEGLSASAELLLLGTNSRAGESREEVKAAASKSEVHIPALSMAMRIKCCQGGEKNSPG